MMFNAMFTKPTVIDSQAALRSQFASDRIYLAAASRVVFEGNITLCPEVMFAGNCQIQGPVQIENGSVLTDVNLGRHNVVRAYSVISNLTAGDRNLFGPFCFLRNGCVVADDCILGAHVESARSTLGGGVRISHRAFVGDAEIGAGTIIGAGVVFCNFDGQRRQRTRVGSGVTIGSGSLLVSPLVVGDDVIIAAGSTVSKDVPPGTKLIQKR
jgi:bifunctional UDP-N-acetylglucosamine pyrophosphorylase/glucosamine-1-phosphate N-acetyltransferase